MAWFGRGLGEFGSAAGEAYGINLDWRQKLQNLALANARQKLADLKGPLELQELQTRIKQMQSPQPAGIERGASVEIGGISWDPQTSTYSFKELRQGVPPEPKFSTLQAAAAYYLQKGDWVKLGQVNDEIAKTKPAAKTPEGLTDVRPDRSGQLWGFDKSQNKYVQINTGKTRFPIPGEGGASAPGNVDAYAYDVAGGRAVLPAGKFGAQVAQRMKELKLEAPLKKPPKPVPPDVAALLTAPVPREPTAEQSRRLADAADRIFGGIAYKQDLVARGRRSPWMGLRSPYADVAYDPQEYEHIVEMIRQSANNMGGSATDASDLGGTPVNAQ